MGMGFVSVVRYRPPRIFRCRLIPASLTWRSYVEAGADADDAVLAGVDAAGAEVAGAEVGGAEVGGAALGGRRCGGRRCRSRRCRSRRCRCGGCCGRRRRRRRRGGVDVGGAEVGRRRGGRAGTRGRGRTEMARADADALAAALCPGTMTMLRSPRRTRSGRQPRRRTRSQTRRGHRHVRLTWIPALRKSVPPGRESGWACSPRRKRSRRNRLPPPRSCQR